MYAGIIQFGTQTEKLCLTFDLQVWEEGVGGMSTS